VRPRKLELQGFTCFNERVEVDFEGLDVFAITGRTGAGKTTIMDALCYALYGKVPRGTTAGSLLSRDARHMHVALEFEAGEGRYRIVRGLTAGRSANTPHVQLERSGGGDDWEPMENRVKEANEAIERIVGLDYAAFTRCVLLPQGEFQQMLSGPPGERQKVLETLLDCTIYDRIRATANARATAMQQEAKLIRGMLETTYAGATDEALSACKAELAETKPRLETETKRRDALMQATQHATAWRQAFEAKREKDEAVGQLQLQIADATAAAEGESAHREQLEERKREADAALAEMAYDQAWHTRLAGSLAYARQAERAEALLVQVQEAAEEASRIEPIEAAAAQSHDALDAARSAGESAEVALEAGRREHAAEHLRAGLKKGDGCPVCGGVVGTLPRGRAPALDALEAAAKTAKAAAEKAAKSAEDAQRKLALAQQRAKQAVESLGNATAEAERAGTELKAAMPEGAPEGAAAIEARLKALDETAARREALAGLIEEASRQLDAHAERTKQAAAVLAGLRGQLKALQQALEHDFARQAEASAALRDLVSRWQWGDVASLIDAGKYPGKMLATMHEAAQEACAELTRRLGTLDQQQRTLKQQIKEAKQHRERLAGIEAEGALYAELADLLHKNHFREWYVGEAAALMADSATDWLGALDPDRRYGLRADGSDFTVIDRWHADEERKPETLSGGETFVVSLALALALAEQLPRIQSSAAAVLESLFLDEGFGTLDTDTLDPVMTALEGLRMEGRLVGIVTHVRELAERIGTRIEVRKSPSGSTLELVTG
jgi:exonuclease SbcC